MTKATVQLETTDLENLEYQNFLQEHEIEAVTVAPAAQIAGAGDIVQYTGNKTDLVLLIGEWFAPGKENADIKAELVAKIQKI